MNNHKSNHTTHSIKSNLIGEKEHREFIEFQSEYGIALRGGSFQPSHSTHTKRLASTINLLNSDEKKQLIFSGNILNN